MLLYGEPGVRYRREIPRSSDLVQLYDIGTASVPGTQYTCAGCRYYNVYYTPVTHNQRIVLIIILYIIVGRGWRYSYVARPA